MENIQNNQNEKEKAEALKKALENMLEQQDNVDCSSGVCVIKGDKSLVERINKKIITEDGRQLLF
jgi:tRNA pseudouridine-54 N-methylase